MSECLSGHGRVFPLGAADRELLPPCDGAHRNTLGLGRFSNQYFSFQQNCLKYKKKKLSL
jgi:hypothetical protein